MARTKQKTGGDGEPVKPTARQTKRRERAVEGWRTAADCIGPVTADLSVFAVTRGQISMIDVVRHLVDELAKSGKPLRASVWTWCIADYEVEAFEWFLSTGLLEAATLVIDRSAEQRNVGLIDRWRAKYGADSVRVCMNHAKIATVSNGDIRVAARGSMNLNFNPRFEQFDITANDGAFDLIADVEGELPVLGRLSSRQEAMGASQVSQAFSEQQLLPFAGAKVWAK